MVIVDANILLYAVNTDQPRHAAAKAWMEQALAGDEAIGFAWMVLLAFVRISTLPAMTPAPLDVGQALDLVDEWLAAAAAAMVHPTGRHPSVLRELLGEAGSGGNLVADCHLAALAVEHGARICTFDRDFARFERITVVTPP